MVPLNKKKATTIRQEDGFTVVRFYDTDIVKFNPEKIILNSGGYDTQTTRIRMNQAAREFKLNFVVYQIDFDWFVRSGERSVPFVDGIEIYR